MCHAPIGMLDVLEQTGHYAFFRIQLGHEDGFIHRPNSHALSALGPFVFSVSTPWLRHIAGGGMFCIEGRGQALPDVA